MNEEGVWIFRIGRVGDALEEPDLNTDLGKKEAHRYNEPIQLL